MLKILLIILLLFSVNRTLASEENLLTLTQQVERLQREVSDLSQLVFSSDDITEKKSDRKIENLSAIDMRLYDLEKDMKNLNANFEELYFKLEDIMNKISAFENQLNNLNDKQINFNNDTTEEALSNQINNNEKNESQTLGTLKISSDEPVSDLEQVNDTNDESFEEVNSQLSPEDQFQQAFDNIRNKKYSEAISSLKSFIKNNPANQLSGSAHYWLGELFILENKYRDAALILAEGLQNYPKSIKVPDMLYKLSVSLTEISKINEACNTLSKLMLDYPNNKFTKKSKDLISKNNC